MTETLIAEATAATAKVWLDSWIGGALGGTPTGWALPGYDDSAWDAPLESDAPCAPAKWVFPQEAFDESRLQGLIWLARLPFTLAEIPTEALLLCANDDSATFYVNGTLVRSASLDLNCGTERSIDPGLLVIGDNVLAARITNSAASGSWAGPPPNSTSVVLRLFAREPDAPGDAVGWDVFAADNLLGAPIATLESAKGRYIRSELHGLGEGGFVINRHAAEATETILAEGNMVKVHIPDCGPEYLDGFFLGADGDYTLLSPSGGQGREDLTFRGPGALDYLDRARMTPCAFSLETTNDTWTQIWTTTKVPRPTGAAFASAEPGYVYVIGQKTHRIYKLDQATQLVVATSPVLWPGSTRDAGGLCIDPSDPDVMWALETPWFSGSTAHTKIHKIDRSGGIGTWAVVDTFDLGSAIKHTDLECSSTDLWLSRYDGSTTVYKRSKTDGSVVSSYSVSYGGTTQLKATGLSVNGTEIAYWYAGTRRALIADLSAPTVVTRVVSTRTIASFGGGWSTEAGEDFFYMVSYTANRVWKYQLTDQVPLCADASGVFHPEQTAPGAIAWRVLVEITHVDRPDQPCPELTFDFTEAVDSNGMTWPARTATEEFTWHVGDRAYSDVLARLIPAGVTFDLDVNTMTLHAYVDATFGVDRTSATFGAGKVRFAQGTNLGVNGDFARRDNRGQPATNITVAGDGAYGTADLAGRYVREGFMQVSGPTTEAVLDAIGDDELARQRLVADAAGFETLWADDETAGRYIPKLHYWKGDLVRVDMGSGEFEYDEADLRVYGTLISERDGGWRSALDLGSAYKIPPPITSIPGDSTSGGDTSGGGSSGGSPTVVNLPLLTVSDGADVEIPRVTRIEAEGAYSPEPGTAVIPRAVADPGLAEDLSTDEVDPTKVMRPDAAGGVAFDAEDPIKLHGTMGTTETFDPADGTVHVGTLDDDLVLTLAAPAVARSFMVGWFTQDPTGGHALSIVAGGGGSFAWSSATPPTIPSAAGDLFRILFETVDAGVTWVGDLVGGDAAVAALEDGVSALAAATGFDFRHGLDVSVSGTTARVAVDEGELTYGSSGDIVAEGFLATALAGSVGKPADAGHRHPMVSYEPLTSGAPSAPELVFTGDGRCVMVPVAD